MKQYLIVTNDIYELPIAVHDSVKEISVTYGIPLYTVYTAIRNYSVIRKINARIEVVETGAHSTNSAQNKSHLPINNTNKKTKFRQKRTTLEVTLPISTADKIISLANVLNRSVSSTIRMLLEGIIL